MTAPDPAASTAATEALTVASAALAETVTSVLVPALLLLEQHTGVLLPAAHTQLGVSLATLQLNAMTVWTAITGHIVLSGNTITARQWQLQTDLAASWSFVAGSVWASVNSQNGALGALGNRLAVLRAAVAFTAGWVRDRFLEMQGYAGNPVRWILQWPVNAGLVAAWNKLNGDFSLNHAIAPVVIPFASGGAVPGAGNTDKVPALLTPGSTYFPSGSCRPGEWVTSAPRISRRCAVPSPGWKVCSAPTSGGRRSYPGTSPAGWSWTQARRWTLRSAGLSRLAGRCRGARTSGAGRRRPGRTVRAGKPCSSAPRWTSSPTPGGNGRRRV